MDLLELRADTAQLTFVAPMRINTTGIGLDALPGRMEMSYKFVPEPAFFWLALAGAAGLALLGRRGLRK